MDTTAAHDHPVKHRQTAIRFPRRSEIRPLNVRQLRVSQAIRRRMNDRGWSIELLSLRTGVRVDVLIAILTRGRRMGIAVRRKLAQAFDCTPTALIDHAPDNDNTGSLKP